MEKILKISKQGGRLFGTEEYSLQQEKDKASNYDAKALWEDCQKDATLNKIYPGILFLLEMLMVFPLSAAVVERLFSRLKLVKTRLRNLLKTEKLSKLLMIGKESTATLNDDQLERILDILIQMHPI